jgi:signal-transduction protein with cAMP-binding, CBS, and nucleotidyltransferase domain
MTERDLLNKVLSKGLDLNNTKVADIISSPVLTIDINATIIDSMEIMMRKKARRLLVTAEGQLAGILTLRDIQERVYRIFQNVTQAAPGEKRYY